MSFFVGLMHEVPPPTPPHPVFLKEWPVYLFSLGAAIYVCVPAVSWGDRHADADKPPPAKKENLESSVCVFTSTRARLQKAGTCPAF